MLETELGMQTEPKTCLEWSFTSMLWWPSCSLLFDCFFGESCKPKNEIQLVGFELSFTAFFFKMLKC